MFSYWGFCNGKSYANFFFFLAWQRKCWTALFWSSSEIQGSFASSVLVGVGALQPDKCKCFTFSILKGLQYRVETWL